MGRVLLGLVRNLGILEVGGSWEFLVREVVSRSPLPMRQLG